MSSGSRRVQLDPGRLLGGATIAEVLELEELSSNDSSYVVLAGGSAVMGWSNRYSDIDIFVIGSRSPVRNEAVIEDVRATVQHIFRDRRFDFEFWSVASIHDLARRLSSYASWTDAPSHPRSLFTYDEEVVLDVIANGFSLSVHGQEDLLQVFDLDLLRKYQTQETVRFLDAVQEDLSGMLLSGHLDVAIFRARAVADLVADGWLHFCGDTNPSGKWRPRKLERVRDHADQERHEFVVAGWWKIHSFVPTDLNDPGIANIATYALQFANRVSRWIQ